MKNKFLINLIIFLISFFSIFNPLNLVVQAQVGYQNYMTIYLKYDCGSWQSSAPPICATPEGQITYAIDYSAKKDDKYRLRNTIIDGYKKSYLIRERDNIVITSFGMIQNDSINLYELKWYGSNSDCTTFNKITFSDVLEAYSNKFPFDLIKNLDGEGESQSCLELKFLERNYPICSIKPLIEVAKNIILLKMVLKAFWSI